MKAAIVIPESAFVEFPIDPHLRGMVGSPQWLAMTHEQRRHFGTFQVTKAKERGQLFPGCCAICGTDGRIQAHHPDYDQPTRIVWLCAKHHVQLHRCDPEFIERHRASTLLTKSGARVPDRFSMRLPGWGTISCRLGDILTIALSLYCAAEDRTKTSVGLEALRCFLQREGYLPTMATKEAT